MDRSSSVSSGRVTDLFTPKPSKTTAHYPLHDADDPHYPDPQQEELLQERLKFPTPQKSSGSGGVGNGCTINIDFCTSCSYRGTAITMLRITTPPPWYQALQANRFGRAFEVYCNGELLFSKLEQRLPKEIELSDLVGKSLEEGYGLSCAGGGDVFTSTRSTYT
ncbi:selT-like protein [Pyrus ussuriensis x Pyrus communis]|uniref:SelT-like protein n=1 Tax=Pyrus ussuriensis x Pyrus communis TaxID=2448454 RepID=A0A5N5H3Z3_9ROSA|nr:selT-like protein [Pyrus ussuriensis x Pyrus communis]